VLCAALALAGCSSQGGGAPAAEDQAPGTATPASPTATGSAPSAAASGASASGSPRPSSHEQPPAPLEIGTGWGPTRREIARARDLVSRLSLTEEAGQVIVARYAGTQPPTRLVNGLHLGGVIVFDENITGADQIRRSNHRLQESAARAGRRWPVFIGVDQEGGIVERVKDGVTPFPAFMSSGAADEPPLTRRAAAAGGAQLASLGFTVDFAPDADVTSGREDPTIGSRSAGSRPQLVARQVNAAVDGFLSSGVLPVIKHFPGHGSVPADSHVELPVQHKSLARLKRSDLVPFKAGVAGGVPAIMVGHLDVRAVDPGVPSSLSRKVVTGLLRHRLGFDGLVVTDALNMGAVTDAYGVRRAAVRALNAGNDVLLMPPRPRAARDAIVDAVRDGRLSRARLDQAATRQVAVLLHQRELRRSVSHRPGRGDQASEQLSAAAVTVVDGPCRGRLVGRSVRVTGPDDAVARFEEAAHRAGVRTGRGPLVALVGYGGAPARAAVVVSLDTPYVLADSRAGVAEIALYGDTPGAMRALVDVLTGRARATGELPVHVPGVARTGCAHSRS
jgi:beta-N-acetylhexosaminidase